MGTQLDTGCGNAVQPLRYAQQALQADGFSVCSMQVHSIITMLHSHPHLSIICTVFVLHCIRYVSFLQEETGLDLYNGFVPRVGAPGTFSTIQTTNTTVEINGLVIYDTTQVGRPPFYNTTDLSLDGSVVKYGGMPTWRNRVGP